MPMIPVAKENTSDVEIYCEDHGAGRPIVLIHGWPLSGRSWEKQVPALLDAGYRVVTYDRRGFGWSSQPAEGYDYDTLAADLRALLEKLDLHDVTLVGFSMGGGEVARYLGTYGADRVRQAVYMAAITPFFLKTADNPAGVDGSVFKDIQKNLREDRPAFLTKFFKDFYNAGKLSGKPVSEEALRLSWITATAASAIATVKCVDAWQEDFRKDLTHVDVPTLIIHGDADKNCSVRSVSETHVRAGQRQPARDHPRRPAWT